MESDEELLALKVHRRAVRRDASELPDHITKSLSGELPEGLELLSASVAAGLRPPSPTSATYILAVRPEFAGDTLKHKIEHLLAGKSGVVRRLVDARALRFKQVDVGGLIRSVRLDGGIVSVECEISPAGSVRVKEILELLGLDAEKLARPVKRTAVQWRSS